MSDTKPDKQSQPDKPDSPPTASTTKPKQTPKRRPRRPLPRWRVLLHNDDVNAWDEVVESLVMITPLNEQDAQHKTKLAHETGMALLLTTHRERAELYVEQLASRNLTATAEPED